MSNLERESLIMALRRFVNPSDLHALSDEGLIRLARRCGVAQ